MKLSSILEIEKKSIISIVGAGGKTTLMYTLAKELKNENKVMVSTTTKIYCPSKEEVDFIAIGEEYNTIRNNKAHGIYAYGKFINDENKLIGIEKEEASKYVNDFDYTLIEADGSKRKQIKGWNSTEPVICNETNITIGVLSLGALGMKINNEKVHRLKEFQKLTNCKIGNDIGIEEFINIIFNENGLFKYSKGEKVLFLNKLDKVNEEDLRILISEINKRNNKYINKIIVGSLKDKYYKIII